MSTKVDVLKDAVSLWDFLKDQAGLDSIFYDQEILEGKPGFPETGLYFKLGITPSDSSFEEVLIQQQVRVEKLLIGLFETLQPYSQMMSDICAFFERHNANRTDQNMTLEFDFDAVNDAKLAFDLNHFRVVIESLQKVKGLTNYYYVNYNTAWSLLQAFHSGYMLKTQNQSLQKWINDYRSDESAVFGSTDLMFPRSGHHELDRQIERAVRVWKSFVNNCASIHPSRDKFREHVYKELQDDRLVAALSAKTAPWEPNDLRNLDSDYWPETFLNTLFGKLELIEDLPADQRVIEQNRIAKAVSEVLDGGSEKLVEEEQLLRELTNLLQLPIWKQRYALYGVWILALLDKVVSSYPRILHHVDGRLSLPFAPTKLLTITTNNGLVELWSEVKSPIDEPTGKSRKYNIQPDYSFYTGEGHKPDNCLAVVEVKQYRRSNNANFAAALNDYSKALVHANVFLVNYGLVNSSLSDRLTNPERSHFFGEIMPQSVTSNTFLLALQQVLPSKPVAIASDRIQFNLIEWEMLSSSPFDTMYIDISGSLNHQEYKTFIQQLFEFLLLHHAPRNLVAVDRGIRGQWAHPTDDDMKALSRLRFENGTDFANVIALSGRNLVVTDTDGLKYLGDKKGLYVIVYSINEPVRIHII